jgi:hypothetical protein
MTQIYTVGYEGRSGEALRCQCESCRATIASAKDVVLVERSSLIACMSAAKIKARNTFLATFLAGLWLGGLVGLICV